MEKNLIKHAQLTLVPQRMERNKKRKSQVGSSLNGSILWADVIHPPLSSTYVAADERKTLD